LINNCRGIQTLVGRVTNVLLPSVTNALAVKAAAMQQQRQKEMSVNFIEHIYEQFENLEIEISSRNQQLETAAGELLQELYRDWHDDNQMRIIMNSEIVDAFKNALIRRANPLIRSFMKLNRIVKATMNLPEKVTAVFSSDKQLQKVRDKLKGNIFDAAKIADILARWSGAVYDYRDPSEWQKTASGILKDFNARDRSNLPDEHWDDIANHIWSSVPWFKKAALVVPMFLFILAAALIPFDGGGSAFIGVTVWEFLGAAGLGGAIGMKLASHLESEFESEIAWNQFANFFAVCCDYTGIPRFCPGADSAAKILQHSLPEAVIEFIPIKDNFGKDKNWCYWQINPENKDLLFKNLELIKEHLK